MYQLMITYYEKIDDLNAPLNQIIHNNHTLFFFLNNKFLRYSKFIMNFERMCNIYIEIIVKLICNTFYTTRIYSDSVSTLLCSAYEEIYITTVTINFLLLCVLFHLHIERDNICKKK